MTTETTTKTDGQQAQSRPAVPKGPYLSQLAGMPAARAWGEQLAADIAFYRRGLVQWNEIDAGLVVYGPPGTGKTTLARAIAATADLPFIATSYSDWSRGHQYGIEVMNAILATFKLAQANAPCIVAIDEIDSIPSRSNIPSDHNATFAIVNTLLDQLDGLNRRPGVIVIGTCNNYERLDPALIRPGRLGRSIEVPLPGLDALPQIIAYHLGPDATRMGDLYALAIMCAGMSGAAVEQFVRDARSLARRKDRSLQKADLVTVLQANSEQRDPAADWRIAVHEAGHAVAALRRLKAMNITVSIVLNGESRGRVTYQAPSFVLTRSSLEDRLVQVLAGRAAEEVFLGDVSAGAGGRATSDLARASMLALDAVASYGLSGSESLFWHQPAGESIARAPVALRLEADALVTKCYREARILIGQEWDFVNLVAADLIRYRAIGHHQFVRCDRRPDRAFG